ncbi:MAG: hypothetical protein K0R17_1450 [Rariglobus sp.]|jgi:hypothetical protein|nr:hypothetical protein [Rariglobus sp.]
MNTPTKIAVSAFFCLIAPLVHAVDKIWGICGHSGRISSPYGVTQIAHSSQLQLIKDLGATYYRMDAGEGDDASLAGLLAAIRANPDFYGPAYKIKILPILYKPASVSFATSTAEQIRQACYNRAVAFVTARKNDFLDGIITEIELENEMAATYGALLPGTNGDLISHYDSLKYAKVKAILRGFCQGVWDGNTLNNTAFNRVVGDAWLHYGYLDQVIADAQVEGWSYCLWNITAWHWYSDMQSSNRIITKLNSYGKPIWITETNDYAGSLLKTVDAQGNVTADPAAYARQSANMLALVRELANQKGVAAIFPYELLDRKTQNAAYSSPSTVVSTDYFGLCQVKYNGTKYYIDGVCPKPSYFDYMEVIDDPVFQTVQDGAVLTLDDSYLPGAVNYYPDASHWLPSTLQKANYATSRHDNAGKGTVRYVRYSPCVPAAGYYQVQICYPSMANRSSNTKVTVRANGQSYLNYVDQRSGSNTASSVVWRTLPGSYYFQAGWTTGLMQYIEISNAGTAAGTYVMADGVRLIRQ